MFFTAGSAIRQASSKSGLTFILAGAPSLRAGWNEATGLGPANGTQAAVVKIDAWPAQGVDTRLPICQGGPFPFSTDDAVFGTRKPVLPRQIRGYDRESPVKAVGARDRGARRTVRGSSAVKRLDACFDTDDHDTACAAT